MDENTRLYFIIWFFALLPIAGIVAFIVYRKKIQKNSSNDPSILKLASEVKILLSTIDKPFDRLGIIKARVFSSKPDIKKINIALKIKAVEMGANAVMQVEYLLPRVSFLTSLNIYKVRGIAIKLNDPLYENIVSDAKEGDVSYCDLLSLAERLKPQANLGAIGFGVLTIVFGLALLVTATESLVINQPVLKAVAFLFTFSGALTAVVGLASLYYKSVNIYLVQLICIILTIAINFISCFSLEDKFLYGNRWRIVLFTLILGSQAVYWAFKNRNKRLELLSSQMRETLVQKSREKWGENRGRPEPPPGEIGDIHDTEKSRR